MIASRLLAASLLLVLAPIVLDLLIYYLNVSAVNVMAVYLDGVHEKVLGRVYCPSSSVEGLCYRLYWMLDPIDARGAGGPNASLYRVLSRLEEATWGLGCGGGGYVDVVPCYVYKANVIDIDYSVSGGKRLCIITFRLDNNAVFKVFMFSNVFFDATAALYIVLGSLMLFLHDLMYDAFRGLRGYGDLSRPASVLPSVLGFLLTLVSGFAVITGLLYLAPSVGMVLLAYAFSTLNAILVAAASLLTGILLFWLWLRELIRERRPWLIRILRIVKSTWMRAVMMVCLLFISFKLVELYMGVFYALGLVPLLLSVFTGSQGLYSLLLSLVVTVMLGFAFERYRVRDWGEMTGFAMLAAILLVAVGFAELAMSRSPLILRVLRLLRHLPG